MAPPKISHRVVWMRSFPAPELCLSRSSELIGLLSLPSSLVRSYGFMGFIGVISETRSRVGQHPGISSEGNTGRTAFHTIC